MSTASHDHGLPRRGVSSVCDPDWNVFTETCHGDVSAAIEQANFKFGLPHFQQT